MNDQYKEMILALPPEFFSDWKCTLGDTILIGEEVAYVGDCGLYKGKVVASDTLIGIEFESKIIPLPNQRQLQDLIMKKFDWSPKALLQMFFFWAEINMKRDDFWSFESWECGWLSYYMDVCYQAGWNGDAWV